MTYLTFRQLSLKEKIDIYNYVQRKKEKSSRELSREILEKNHVYINPRTIRGWREGKKPRWVRLMPSSELAYLLGLVLGDGWIEYKRIANGYYIGVTSTKKEIPKLFRDACTKIFGKLYAISQGRYGKMTQYRCMIGCKELYELVRKGKEDIRNIASYITLHPNDFVRGFADAEGSIIFYKPRRGIVVQIKVTNSNRKLLLFTKKLLSQNGIYASLKINHIKGDVCEIHGRKVIAKRNIYDLVIARQQDVIKYAELIGFCHPQKRKKLEEAINFIKSWHEIKNGTIKGFCLCNTAHNGG